MAEVGSIPIDPNDPTMMTSRIMEAKKAGKLDELNPDFKKKIGDDITENVSKDDYGVPIKSGYDRDPGLAGQGFDIGDEVAEERRRAQEAERRRQVLGEEDKPQETPEETPTVESVDIDDGIGTPEFNDFIANKLESTIAQMDEDISGREQSASELQQKEGRTSEEEAELAKMREQIELLKSRRASLTEMAGLKKTIQEHDKTIKTEKDNPLAKEDETNNLINKRLEPRKKLFELYKRYYAIAVPGEDRLAIPNPDDIEPFVEKPDDIVPVEPKPEYVLPPELAKEKLRIVDVSEQVQAMSWRNAQNLLTNILNWRQEGGFLGTMKGLFSRRFVRSQVAQWGERGYLRKFFWEASRTITENQNLRDMIEPQLGARESARIAGDRNNQWDVLDAAVEQVTDETIEARERGEDNIAAGDMFADLFRRHIRGEFADRGAFETAAREVIEGAVAAGSLRREQFYTDASRAGEAKGLMYASNLFEVAEKYRDGIMKQFEAGGRYEGLNEEQKKEAIDCILGTMNLDIQLATKMSDVLQNRPERPDQRGSYLGFFDRMSDAARSRPILGAIINPTTLGLLGSLAPRSLARGIIMAGAATGGLTAAGTVGAFALPIAVGAGMAGVFGYLRRRTNLAQDRSTEQNREALGTEGEGERASRLREFGFSGISQSAEDLIEAINAGDTGALLEAAALQAAERRLLFDGRPVDLITGNYDETEQYETNIISKTALKRILRDRRAELEANADALSARVDSIVDQVKGQDSRFEGYRRKESVKSGLKVAAVGAVIGVAAQELITWASEHITGKVGENLTLMRFLMGKRPEAEHWDWNGLHLVQGDRIPGEEIAMNQSGDHFTPLYELGKDGQMHIVPDSLPPGYTFNPDTGDVFHQYEVVSHGPITPRAWDELQKVGHSTGMKSEHVSWREFGFNRTEPMGNSWHEAFYQAHSNGTELQMDFHPNTDGSVNVDIRRMLEHVAASSHNKLEITDKTLDEIKLTLSPRDQLLQHEALTITFKDGVAKVSATAAKMFFRHTAEGGVDVNNGVMATASMPLEQGSDGVLHAMSIAEKHATGPIEIVRPIVEWFHPNPDPTTYVPPTNVVPPFWIGKHPREPIGNRKKRDKNHPQEEESPDDGQKVKVAAVEDRETQKDEPHPELPFDDLPPKPEDGAGVAAVAAGAAPLVMEGAGTHKLDADKAKLREVREAILEEPAKVGLNEAHAPKPEVKPSNSEIKINTGSWSKEIPHKKYDDMIKNVNRILAGREDELLQEPRQRFEVMKGDFIREFVENRNGKVDPSVARSMMQIHLGLNERGQDVYIKPEDLKFENAKKFESFLKRLRIVLLAEGSARIEPQRQVATKRERQEEVLPEESAPAQAQRVRQ